MIPSTTKFRLYVFDTLAFANASTRTFENGTFIMIKGDFTRFKMGGGIAVSFDTPPSPTAQTFAQLPWFNGQPTNTSAFAAPATATLTAAQLAQRLIVTTSAAATTLTLPTAALLATQLGAIQDTQLAFTIDNTGGANTVTVAVGTGIVVGAGALTGNTTMTIAGGQIGKFLIFFKSATAALLYRTL